MKSASTCSSPNPWAARRQDRHDCDCPATERPQPEEAVAYDVAPGLVAGGLPPELTYVSKRSPAAGSSVHRLRAWCGACRAPRSSPYSAGPDAWSGGVPHHEIMLPPRVGVHELSLRRVLGKIARESHCFRHRPADNAADVG